MISTDMISVIVPAYNISPYIERCVDSILKQTYHNLEVILVDDGSVDGTGAILDAIGVRDQRVKIIHQANGGVTNARFTGIEAASGNWIGFVDGDDIIDPDMYEHLLNNAYKYGADISHCGYKMVFSNRVDYYHNTGQIIEHNTKEALKELITGKLIEPALFNKLYKAELVKELVASNEMDRSIAQLEDLLMNFLLFEKSKKLVFEDYCPYHYLIREGSACISNINESKLSDPLKVMNIIKAEIADDPELIRIVNGRTAGILVNLATMSKCEDEALVAPHRTAARKQLRHMVPELIKGKYSSRTKILSTWAALWPWSYQSIHTLYQKLHGTDKKYEVS